VNAQPITIVIRLTNAARGIHRWTAVHIKSDGTEHVIVSDVSKPIARAEARAYRKTQEN
jgi:hypothetical protein